MQRPKLKVINVDRDWVVLCVLFEEDLYNKGCSSARSIKSKELQVQELASVLTEK